MSSMLNGKDYLNEYEVLTQEEAIQRIINDLIKAKDMAKPISFSNLGERVHGTIVQVKPEKGTYIVKTTEGIKRELEIEKAWRFDFDA